MNVHTFTVTLDQADGITAASMLELVAVNARRDAAEARRIDSPAGPNWQRSTTSSRPTANGSRRRSATTSPRRNDGATPREAGR